VSGGEEQAETKGGEEEADHACWKR
jgi:hypothetical protein